MFELYEKYQLKNGDIGRAVEVLGNGEACIFEFENRKLEDRVDTIFWNEIKEKIRIAACKEENIEWNLC